jgi:hypothetical protein
MQPTLIQNFSVFIDGAMLFNIVIEIFPQVMAFEAAVVGLFTDFGIDLIPRPTRARLQKSV